MQHISKFWQKRSNTNIKVGSLYRLKELPVYSYHLHNGDNSCVAPQIKTGDIVLCVSKHVATPFVVYKNKTVPGFLYNNIIGTLGAKEILEIDFEEIYDDR